jgi:hypothetical protein
MPKDFTLTIYRQLLLTIQQAGYSFFTFEEWCDGKAKGRYVILRHDVDLKAGNSLITAKLEFEMGIRASYYFRVVPQSNKQSIIRDIAKYGHEIGYHYEDLSLFKGDKEKAIKHFEKQLHYFHQFYIVRTICMHGSPASKWDNRDIWKTYNYRDFGIIGEPYFDFLNNESVINNDRIYYTDTARMWDGEKYNVRDKLATIREKFSGNKSEVKKLKLKSKQDEKDSLKIHSTFDFINWFQHNPKQPVIMITTHPQRWTDDSIDWYLELFKQSFKNVVKKFIVRNS